MSLAVLDSHHYLGSRGARARTVIERPGCLITLSAPASRRIPQDWLELSRWCITTGVGSQHWAEALRELRAKYPDCTTVISYSDPSVGHDGGLYRACGWLWAPTWHVLRPPPTGGGTRGGKRQEPKHRWVYLLRPDPRRQEILRLRDASLARRYPFASYTEPVWRRGVPRTDDLKAAYKQWSQAR